MSKASKACDISPSVRREVRERDGGRCIICGSTNGIQIAHYISRGRLGLGIPQNLACMCHICHAEMDNGTNTTSRIKTPLRGIYVKITAIGTSMISSTRNGDDGDDTM